MTTPLTHAFFLGRATAEVLSQELETAATSMLSEIGKFDAEQRQRLRQFTTQVMERANQAEAQAQANQPESPQPSATAPMGADPQSRRQTVDLQATLDELRAEIARLRFELQQHRNTVS
jgi:hypothetical protein